jgi:pilus assembly protein FimV
MALAAATVLGLWSSQVTALSLGRVVVQSGLGEPLRAEIEILDITEEEARSLRPRLAQPDAYRANGMEYSPTLNGLQVSLQRRPDGRHVLRLSNPRAVNEPYVDLILEATWSSGRIVRDYTLLFDPPATGASQPVAPQVSAPEAVRVAPPAAATPAPAEPAVASAAAPAAAPASDATPRAAAPQAAPANPASGRPRVTVKAGDTASKIAQTQKPADVSLDQMLVAMLRSNPEAFIGGNVHRLRRGAVLELPDAEQAQAVAAEEARQIILAQSRDFNEYRRRLAGSAPLAAETAADRSAAGSVQPQVQEKKPAATTADKLTLSKGAVQAQTAEDKLAQQRSTQDAASRAEELAKNVAELEKLSKASAPESKPATAPAPSTAPAATVAAPAASAPPAPAVTAAPPAAVASAPAAPASASAAAAPKPAASKPRPAPAPVVEEPSLLDDLLENPVIPAAAGGLIALLAGLAFYRVRQRKNAAQVDSAYLESRLQPDSFFGESGGQRVDTNDAGMSSSSSMVYSPSQLDAGDDVDPVAEADVYLAYGRDLQAEEILKEALRTHPSRVAIHQKLCEIYAKRRDTKSFGATAKEAYRLTGGNGSEWEHICELGASIDPSNPMYKPGGQPPVSAPAPLMPEPSAPAAAAVPDRAPAAGAAAASAATTAAPALSASGGVDLDLDLDFSLDEPQPTAPSATPTAPAPVAATGNSLEFEAPTLPEISPTPAESAKPAANLMNFDLGGLSLDLETPSEQPGAGSEDPLATKLALADEFKAIGDTDGARALIEEIIAEASGEMKERAQKALAALG